MFLKIKFKESQVFYTFNNKYSVIRTRSKLTFISNMNTTSKVMNDYPYGETTLLIEREAFKMVKMNS
ncbi:hypothetical protein HUJ04_005230 [Dendroctonus ponderosae]|nr:hypothetical protein HUJ04_005230 [Dendroctonus ponderosae]